MLELSDSFKAATIKRLQWEINSTLEINEKKNSVNKKKKGEPNENFRTKKQKTKWIGSKAEWRRQRESVNLETEQ